ncbi:hypothetical protein IFVP18_C150634 [Vibrio parahaemolyticus]
MGVTRTHLFIHTSSVAIGYLLLLRKAYPSRTSTFGYQCLN